LNAGAWHTTGYQWQKDGSNLVEGLHFAGVTNATLTISNVGLADAGMYAVVAQHPTSPATNSAVLSVFKPIKLSLLQPAPGSLRLLATNADGSAFEPERLTNVAFYSTSDPTFSISNWTLSTSPVVLTNGVLQIDITNAGAGGSSWIAIERP
jgi:hypothetical protein